MMEVIAGGRGGGSGVDRNPPAAHTDHKTHNDLLHRSIVYNISETRIGPFHTTTKTLRLEEV